MSSPCLTLLLAAALFADLSIEELMNGPVTSVSRHEQKWISLDLAACQQNYHG